MAFLSGWNVENRIAFNDNLFFLSSATPQTPWIGVNSASGTWKGVDNV